ncbi:lactoylglutathione lyase and related lyases [Streptococcus suis]|nr:lactoylglutathione lyase and related lyases [Streptococcus suis]
MKFDAVHHIAIIGSDYDKTREFYVEKLGFEQVDEYIRPEKMIFSSMSKKAI